MIKEKPSIERRLFGAEIGDALVEDKDPTIFNALQSNGHHLLKSSRPSKKSG